MRARAKHIAIYGNPVDGFRYVGPFESKEDALTYVADEPSSDNWWVAELYAPAEEE